MSPMTGTCRGCPSEAKRCSLVASMPFSTGMLTSISATSKSSAASASNADAMFMQSVEAVFAFASNTSA